MEGEAPSRRRKYLLHVHNNKLYVHGGAGRDGELFDDVYMLDMGAKRWSCLYKGENVNALSAAGRRVAFVNATLVSISVGSPGVLDAVTVLDLDALNESQVGIWNIRRDHMEYSPRAYGIFAEVIWNIRREHRRRAPARCAVDTLE